MGKRIIRNADLLKKAQDSMHKAQDSTNNAESQNTDQEEITLEQIIPTAEQTIPTIEQIDDICSYAPTCQDDWNNKEWGDICTESDYKEFIEIIQPFCIKNPDFMGCDDCL